MEITGHKQGKMKDSFICNIPVPPLPEQKSKNYCCDECVGDYSKTDVLQEFPVAMAYVPWQQWRKLHDLGYGFQCGTIFKSLKNHFVEKEDAVNELQLS